MFRQSHNVDSVQWTLFLPSFSGARPLGAVVLVYFADRQRSAAIRAFATRSGFHYIGDALPRSVTLRGTPLQGVSKVWNVIDGEPRGVRIVAFDCRVGVGKGSWKRTVIAVADATYLPPALPFNSELTIDTAGNWKILYRPKAAVNFRIARLMSVDELESYLSSFAPITPR